MDVFRTENNCLKFHYDAEELWIQPWCAGLCKCAADAGRGYCSEDSD